MAQTHEDKDFDWNRLHQRADNMTANQLSVITTGEPGEVPLDEYDYEGMRVTRRAADEQDIARVSIGAGTVGESRAVRYCVFRGLPEVCVALLDEAAKAIRQE